jgi:hypothetical protein
VARFNDFIYRIFFNARADIERYTGNDEFVTILPFIEQKPVQVIRGFFNKGDVLRCQAP